MGQTSWLSLKVFIVVVESNPLEIKVIGGLMRYTKGDPIIMLKLMDRV